MMLNYILHMNAYNAMCQYYKKQITDGKIKVGFLPCRGIGHKMNGVDY